MNQNTENIYKININDYENEKLIYESNYRIIYLAKEKKKKKNLSPKFLDALIKKKYRKVLIEKSK